LEIAKKAGGNFGNFETGIFGPVGRYQNTSEDNTNSSPPLNASPPSFWVFEKNCNGPPLQFLGIVLAPPPFDFENQPQGGG